MLVEKRSGIDRRSGKDRRKEYDVSYFLDGGHERRSWKERRTRGERRKDWEQVSESSSLFVGGLRSHSKELVIERRKHKRFQIKDGAFALFGSHTAKVGQIIDMSASGLAFRYVGSEERSSEPFELDVFLTDNSFYLERLPVKTISDLKIGNETSSVFATTRRRGVKFGELTQSQISELQHFIQNHAVGEV